MPSEVPFNLYYPGAYSSTAAYSPGALIVTGGHVYVCIDYVTANSDGNTAPASDTSHWTALT